MNLKQVTLVPPSGPAVVLGSVSYTGGVPSGYTLEDLRLNPAERTVRTAALPLVAGGMVAPGRPSFRAVEVAGMIVAADSAGVMALRRVLIEAAGEHDGEPLRVRWVAAGTTVELLGYLDGAVEVAATGSHFVRYSFRIVCADPVAYSSTVSTAELGAYPGVAAVNAGNAEVWPEVTVTLSGTVSSVRVGNSTTGSYMQVDDLAGTGPIVIVSAPGFETVEQDGVPILNKVNGAATFVSLVPGANDLYVTVLAGDGSASGLVTWRNGWID